MTLGLFDSMIATHEFVVPRSMPMTLMIVSRVLRKVSLGSLDDLTTDLGGGGVLVLLEYCSQHRGLLWGLRELGGY